MHQFGWLSERGGNFLNLLQKEGGTQKGGVPSEKGGVPTLEETMIFLYFYLAVKKLMIAKNSVVKIQNFVVNHES